ncbi:2623_t:CDS:2 [Paraglomus brasilianum]|uniref:2623_t:CDS:1 n=1 Tax=Paraglomus brasilianum TaxID=144538 RepID=A0A9N9AHR8_9GLOM|nr:2623_t:CDS:2 [Paraglomus brasilianum]
MVARLAKLVPIDPSRITTNRRNQPDPKAPAHQILLSVTLKSSDDRSQRTVQQIIDDLDDLVRNKGYNSFSLEYPTSCLDETYGFLPVANLWATYEIKLIGLFVGLLILAIIYFFARWKHPEGQNFVVVKLVLIVTDLSLDIAFVLLSARNVPQILKPSIIFLIVPIIFNSGLAFSILMNEIRKTDFQEWFVWQSTTPDTDVDIIGCEVAVGGVGHLYRMGLENNATTTAADYVKVAFLSTGSVTDTT